MNSDDTPIFKLEELEAHLQELVKSPETPIDAKLFDAVELQLTGMPFSILYCRGAPNSSLHVPQSR